MMNESVREKTGDIIKKIAAFLLAVISTGAVDINFASTAETDSKGIVYAVLYSLQGWGLAKLLCAVGLTCLYWYFIKTFSVRKEIAVFSFLLSSFILMGKCYRDAVGLALLFQNAAQMIKGLIIFTGWGGLLYCSVYLLIVWMKKLKKKLETGETERGKRSRIKDAIFIFICWLPWLIGFYPGTTTYDAGTMLEQYFGYAPLTNHHPYFQILLIGIFVKTGHMLGSAALGMFIYILIQAGAFIAVIVYMAGFLEKMGLHKRIVDFLICVYALVPIFPLYAISVGKNINFSIAVLLMTIFMFEIIADAESFAHSPVKLGMLFAVSLLIFLFRNEGIAFVIGCFPCMILMAKKFRKVFWGIFAGVLVFYLIWMKGILPAAGVENGSIAEALSIPFLQTARCVRYYGSEMSEEEKQAIDDILEYDTLADRYLPEFSDRVKEKYNNAATWENWRAYIKVYLRQMKEHPVTYVDAVFNKCYGYFYPDDEGRTKSYYVYYADVPTLNENGFDLRSRFRGVVNSMGNFLEAFRNVPLLGYTTSIGAYFWCAFLSMFCVTASNKKRLLFLFMPVMVTLFVCIISPVNAYFRYGLPAVFSAPLFISVAYYAVTSEEGKVIE